MKKLVIVSISLALSAGSFAQKKTKSPLDGRIYSVTLTEEGKKKPEPVKDDVTLMGGKLKSNFMMQAGFNQADYDYEVDSTASPLSIKFTAEAKTEAQERFSWEATADGDDVSGTAIIRKKGKIEHTYNFKGTWKNKKKPRPAPKAAVPAKDSTKAGQ